MTPLRSILSLKEALILAILGFWIDEENISLQLLFLKILLWHFSILVIVHTGDRPVFVLFSAHINLEGKIIFSAIF